MGKTDTDKGATAPARRRQALDCESTTAQFLYAIIKQLDVRNVDWQIVADAIEIPKGHAARMRFTRFKAQIDSEEGAATKTMRKKKDGAGKEQIVDQAQLDGIRENETECAAHVRKTFPSSEKKRETISDSEDDIRRSGWKRARKGLKSEGNGLLKLEGIPLIKNYEGADGLIKIEELTIIRDH